MIDRETLSTDRKEKIISRNLTHEGLTMNFQRIVRAAMSGTLLLATTATAAEQPSSPKPSSLKSSSSQPASLLASPKAPTVKKMELQKKQFGDMQPLHTYGDIYLAGQPTPEDLTLLKQEGFKTIITLRKPNEVSWDEAATVTQHGMKFVEVPFQDPAELKPEVFDQVLKVLRDKERGPTVLHCASSNRVGAIWYAYRVLDGKLAPEAALREAKIVGLRTPDYFERAQAYVVQVRSREPTQKP